MCRKGHKTQKNYIKISQIRLKEVIFTVLRSKARILCRLWKILRRRASVCLPLLESLLTISCVQCPRCVGTLTTGSPQAATAATGAIRAISAANTIERQLE